MTIGKTTLRRAIQALRSGAPYIVIGRSHLKDLGLAESDTVSVTLEPYPEPDRFDLADELAEALRQDDGAQARWEIFTLGAQRSLDHYVSTAKREDTSRVLKNSATRRFEGVVG